jgi:hypothetical protein
MKYVAANKDDMSRSDSDISLPLTFGTIDMLLHDIYHLYLVAGLVP